MNYILAETSTVRCDCEKPITVKDQTKRILDLACETLTYAKCIKNDIFPNNPEGIDDNRLPSPETLQEILGVIEVQLNKTHGTLLEIREHIG